MSKIEIRRLDDHGIADLQWLLKTVHHVDFSQDYLRKKYDFQRFGMKPLALLAYSGSQVVASYGGIPQRYCSYQGTVMSAYISDLFTVPEFQKQGIHKWLGQQFNELANAEGIRFLTAFQSVASQRASRSTGYRSIGKMQCYIIALGGMPMRRMLWKVKKQIRPNAEEIEKVLGPHRIDPSNIRNSYEAKGGLWHDYDPDFYAYKCFTPNLHIQLGDTKFWVKADGAMHIGDTVFETVDGLKSAISELKALCRRLGQRELIFQVQKRSAVDLALRDRVTPIESWPIEYLDLNPGAGALDLTQLKMNLADFDTF